MTKNVNISVITLHVCYWISDPYDYVSFIYILVNRGLTVSGFSQLSAFFFLFFLKSRTFHPRGRVTLRRVVHGKVAYTTPWLHLNVLCPWKEEKKGFLFIVKIWERMKMYLSTGLNLFHAFSCYTVFLFFKVIFLSSLRLAASRAGRRCCCCCCSSFFFFTFWKTAKIGNPKVQTWKQNQTLSA